MNVNIPDSFRGHGIVVDDAARTIDTYGSAQAVVQAARECHMTHAWLRVHGRRTSLGSDGSTRALLTAFRRAGIHVAGWGWCQGDDPFAEAELAVRSMRALELQDYVADIREGVRGSHWTQLDVTSFLGEVRAKLTGKIAVTSFGLITWHGPELIKAADPLVDAFVPQIYWYDFPSTKMRLQFGHKFRADDAASYADLCIQRWVKVTLKPLIFTGQAFWEEGFDQSAAEAKLAQFLERFSGWSRIVGMNWYHPGASSMSGPMHETLCAARVDEKRWSAKGLPFGGMTEYDPRIRTSSVEQHFRR